MRPNSLLPFLLISVLVCPVVVAAQWQPNGVALCTVGNDQHSRRWLLAERITLDGAGGAIVTWTDERSGTGPDIYVQRINSWGAVQWPGNGVALCTADSIQDLATIVSDGAGGAIVAWSDNRNGNRDIYAQRVSGGGVVQWLAGGVALCTVDSIQDFPTIVPDGAGGAIVAWSDNRTGDYDAYAQRIDASGTVLWTANGAPVCTATGGQYIQDTIADEAGGAITTWVDTGFYYDILAQRIDASGTVQWATRGVALCHAAETQYGSQATSDGAGGAIVSWYDYRGESADIYAQRVSASGAVQWTTDGVAICTAALGQYTSLLVPDMSGGAFLAWSDERNADVYLQRVDAAGTVLVPDGFTISTALGSQLSPALIPDGGGGAILSWVDTRSGTSDIYAQRINHSGIEQWTSNGVPICTAAGSQSASVLVTDEAGGAIIAWDGARSAGSYDISALRIGPGGLIATVVDGTPSPASIALTPNFPNPFSSTTTFDLSVRWDATVEIEIFDVAGRRVRAIDVGRVAAGSKRMSFDGFGDDGKPLVSGVYFYRVHAAGETVTRKMVIAH